MIINIRFFFFTFFQSCIAPSRKLELRSKNFYVRAADFIFIMLITLFSAFCFIYCDIKKVTVGRNFFVFLFFFLVKANSSESQDQVTSTPSCILFNSMSWINTSTSCRSAAVKVEIHVNERDIYLIKKEKHTS